jgi:hypothetical protein
MKRIYVLLILCSFFLPSCSESNKTTTVKKKDLSSAWLDFGDNVEYPDVDYGVETKKDVPASSKLEARTSRDAPKPVDGKAKTDLQILRDQGVKKDTGVKHDMTKPPNKDLGMAQCKPKCVDDGKGNQISRPYCAKSGQADPDKQYIWLDGCTNDIIYTPDMAPYYDKCAACCALCGEDQSANKGWISTCSKELISEDLFCTAE